MGKTSLLEAVYFLATTKSFRTSRLVDCRRWDRPALWVNGLLGGERHTTLEASWKEGGASRSVNGKKVALGEYLALLPTVSWSSQDGALLDGDLRARRRLLDQGVVGSRALPVAMLSRYRRVLAAKRSLLASGGGGLASWNQLLAEAGHRVVRERAAYAAELGRAFAAVGAELGLRLPEVRLRYRPNPEGGASLEEFTEALERAEATERRLGRPRVGPHRDRLRIEWGPSDIARAASAGERKLFGLVLTAARARILTAGGAEPLLLLDDLDAALDRDRLRRVWKLFAGAGQVFVTSADPDLGGQLEGASEWRLEGGRIGRS